MKIMHVVGARPNFMKVAPILNAFRELTPEVTNVLVHTGQHFDRSMSDVFFDELAIPSPDENLGIGGGSHAEQTGRLLIAFEPIILKHNPDWLFVVGDVNATMACSLVAAKLGVPIAHVEAGLRSGDMTMPEEINRKVTDALADLLFTPSSDGDINLLREGVSQKRIKLVGNVMIDTVVRMLPAVDRCSILERMNLAAGHYALVTLHRPSNVDDPVTLKQLLAGLERSSKALELVFPVHPRTRHRMQELNLFECAEHVRFIDPVSYIECLTLESKARLVITDSGGVQEETTFLGVPCLTVRSNTERPVTISQGTNRLVKSTADALFEAVTQALSEPPASFRRVPVLWDGKAAERIVRAWQSTLSEPISLT